MRNRGFISQIILIVVAVILLKVLLDIDVLAWLKSQPVKDFFIQVGQVIVSIWEDYLKGPVMYVINFIKDLFPN